ncbi:GPI mannosyltransferase 1 [Neocloeon triangulifer]|uniref:GPI mannosyltransferase 1 n=1 Tax=Neocloeon triangulifer TaxID=2078957 RepID=UPI00286EFF9A|nr:GPI mannosyltransferase 1 [Neocloeon triangulifer]
MFESIRSAFKGVEQHLLRALVLRLALVAASGLLDHHLPVKYTDVDYLVFSDAAAHVAAGRSPYQRHTYRYPPILAWLLVPNLWLHPAFGKVLFSLADVAVGLLIHRLLLAGGIEAATAATFAQAWWLNPIPIVICTRGSADALTACLVLAALLAAQKARPGLTGLLMGTAVHLRLYPVVLGFNFLAACSTNSARFRLCLAGAVSFGLLTWFSWLFYGHEFLEHSYLYHLDRRDARHNFSPLFYPLYLMGAKAAWLGTLSLVLQAALVITVAMAFAKRKADLPFASFCACAIFVAYNKVVTAQYFIWFLSLLPACAARLRVSATRALVLTGIWLVTQVTWLLPAYLLEFQGLNTFLLIWLYSLAFFIVNVFVLAELAACYQPAPPPHHTTRPKPRTVRR